MRSVGLFFSLVFYNTIWQNYAPVESLAVQENNYGILSVDSTYLLANLIFIGR